MRCRARTLVLLLLLLHVLLLQLHSQKTCECALRDLCKTQEIPAIRRPSFELPNTERDACSITAQFQCKVRWYRRRAGLSWQALQYRVRRGIARVWDSTVDLPQRLRGKMAGLATFLAAAWNDRMTGLATLLAGSWDDMLMLWSATSYRMAWAYRTTVNAMARATPAVLGRTWDLLTRPIQLCTIGPLIWVFGQARAFLEAVPQAVSVVVAEVLDMGQILLDTLEQSLREELHLHLCFAYRYAVVSLLLHLVGAVAALTWLARKLLAFAGA